MYWRCALVELDQADNSAAAVTLTNKKAGRWERLLLKFAGTNGASYDVGASMGNILATIVGRKTVTLCNADCGRLQTFANWRKGLVDNTAGTTFHALVPIPVQMPGHPNALHVGPHEITCQVPASGTTTCTVTLLGVPSREPENYVLSTYERSQTLTGSDPLVVDEENIAFIVLFAPATTNPTMINIHQDNEKECETDWEPFVYTSDWLGIVEAASLASCFCTFFDSDHANVLARNIDVHLTGGAGAMYYFVVQATFDESRRIMTEAQKVRHLNMKMADKGVSVPYSAAIKSAAAMLGEYVAPSGAKGVPGAVSPDMVRRGGGVT